MRSHLHPEPTFSDLLASFWRYRGRFAAVALLVSGLAAAYAFWGVRPWEASQAILLRAETLGSLDPLAGREENRQSSQKTLLELSASHAVLHEALQAAGPDRTTMPARRWPDARDVEQLRRAVTLVPPKGAEFGTTDVFYLKVKHRDRARALQLVDALYGRLDRGFKDLRAAAAQKAEAELRAAVAEAERNLGEATRRVAEIEHRVGVDLVALRMLEQAPNGEVALFRTLTNTMDELRQVRATEQQQAAVLAYLQDTQADADALVSAPPALTEIHPALSRLIQGLSEARLRCASLASKMTDAHPGLVAARQEEQEIRHEIGLELRTAKERVTATHRLTLARRQAMEEQVDELNTRVDRVSTARVQYADLIKQIDHRRSLLEESQRKLAVARALQASAAETSLLSRLDAPDGGLRPAGPSRATIVLFGLVAGFAAGAGTVLVTTTLRQPPTGGAETNGRAPRDKPAERLPRQRGRRPRELARIRH